ncbi:glycogen/starch/alpha-glucan phosphorylase [Tunturiibacter gelidoferens]|uniref:glycogen/starch/alpha-glucan phosphorylase n=1 Tax=Tunturiibacter gelidiferens TaxID=3069689 RepID=UPI00333E888A
MVRTTDSRDTGLTREVPKTFDKDNPTIHHIDKAILNVAGSRRFSSDRTIGEYAADIWNAIRAQWSEPGKKRRHSPSGQRCRK